MYEKNFYLGQKILFAMFFSSDLKSQGGEATSEDEKKINSKYVTTKIGKEECISSVLEFYGYTVAVVTNYEEAIHELCKKIPKINLNIILYGLLVVKKHLIRQQIMVMSMPHTTQNN